MLALAPDEVHLDRISETYTVDTSQRDEIKRLVLDRATTWPWASDDARIATMASQEVTHEKHPPNSANRSSKAHSMPPPPS